MVPSPLELVVTPCHLPGGATLFQLSLLDQFAPLVAL